MPTNEIIIQSDKDVYRKNNNDICFKDIERYNPLVDYCTRIGSDGDSIEFPIFSTNNNAWARDPSLEAKKNEANYSLNIRLFSLFSRLKMSKRTYSRTFSENINNQLLNQIDNLLRETLLNGKKPCDDEEQYAPIGLINAVNKKHDIDLNDSNGAVNSILELIQNIPSMYQSNAIFILSNKTLHKLNTLRQTVPQLLFDGISNLFGHKIVAMDEIGDDILFGDFKQAVVVAFSNDNYIEEIKDPSTPTDVAITMQTAVGMGIINQDAIILGKVLTSTVAPTGTSTGTTNAKNTNPKSK